MEISIVRDDLAAPAKRLIVPGQEPAPERAQPAKGRGGFPRPRVILPDDVPLAVPGPVHEAMMAAVDELEARIRRVPVLVACPTCRAPKGEVCRAMPVGWSRRAVESGGRLKHSHAARLRAAGISTR